MQHMLLTRFKYALFSEKNVLFEGLTKLWLKYLKVHKNWNKYDVYVLFLFWY